MKSFVKTPSLRFKEFNDNWTLQRIDSIFDRVTNQVNVVNDSDYSQIGIRSHGKGIFYKDSVKGVELGNKRVFWLEEDLFIVNIVFAWEMAIAKTTTKEIGLIASHRFPMYRPKKDKLNLDFILYFFLRKRGKLILELASPGGAGRNKTLGQKEFLKSKIYISNSVEEQEKIANFLTAVDTKIATLTKKKTLLEQYKKGVMQQLFSQKLRFKQADGSDYPEWERKRLGEIGITLNGLTGKTKENFGLGKPYVQYKQIFDSSKINISNCDLVDVTENEKQTKVNFGDVFFTTSSETPNEIGTASVLLDQVDELYLNSFCFGFRVTDKVLNPHFSRFLFRAAIFRRKMIPLAQGSTRYNISKSAFVKLEVFLPSIEEQTKIANFLTAIDQKIEATNTQIESSTTFKKGLLQQMFV